MSELFREIDSELRQDKAREWLLRYGPRILIVCVIGIFLVAIGVYLREQEMERREAATAELIGIVGEGPRPTDLSVEQLQQYVANTKGEIAAIGQFHLAGELARDGDVGGALANYKELSANSDLTQELRDLASLYSIMLRMNDENQTADALIAELAPLSGPEVAWNLTAQELTALLHIKNGNEEQGRQIIADLLEVTNLPLGMRRRLFQWTEIYGEPANPEQS